VEDFTMIDSILVLDSVMEMEGVFLVSWTTTCSFFNAYSFTTKFQ
jgi:hypothetical protein